MTYWVVGFQDCDEAVIRKGSRNQADYPDDLGCPVSFIRPIESVNISEIWDKNGQRRCEFTEKIAMD